MLSKSTKVLVTALVFAGTSLAFVADASARPLQRGWQVGAESFMQERHDPTNTNSN